MRTNDPLSDYHSFDPAEGHGLPHDPIKAIVAPRPIGWISSVDNNGKPNLAPYSYFNIFSHKPPILIFGSEGRKDSLTNIEQTKSFVFNLATRNLSKALNQTSAPYPPEVDEFTLAGLKTVASDKVAAPRVAGVAAAMECKLVQIQAMKNAAGKDIGAYLIIGEVVQVHIDKAFLVEGLFDITKARTIARCGYRGDYIEAEKTFEMLRPAS